MDGSTASLIAIPIVVTLSLAAWLIMVAYAAAHPKWKHSGAAAGAGDHLRAGAPVAPAEPRPAQLAHRAPADAEQVTRPAEPAKRAA